MAEDSWRDLATVLEWWRGQQVHRRQPTNQPWGHISYHITVSYSSPSPDFSSADIHASCNHCFLFFMLVPFPALFLNFQIMHTFHTLFILGFIISFWVLSWAEYILLHFGKEFILLGRRRVARRESNPGLPYGSLHCCSLGFGENINKIMKGEVCFLT